MGWVEVEQANRGSLECEEGEWAMEYGWSEGNG